MGWHGHFTPFANTAIADTGLQLIRGIRQASVLGRDIPVGWSDEFVCHTVASKAVVFAGQSFIGMRCR